MNRQMTNSFTFPFLGSLREIEREDWKWEWKSRKVKKYHFNHVLSVCTVNRILHRFVFVKCFVFESYHWKYQRLIHLFAQDHRSALTWYLRRYTASSIVSLWNLCFHNLGWSIPSQWKLIDSFIRLTTHRIKS